MTSLKEAAQGYEPPQVLNIADLDKVPLDLQVMESEEKTNAEGEKFKYKYAELNGKQ